MIGSNAYLDPLEQMSKSENARYQRKQGCLACEKRPKQVGGNGACKANKDREWCRFFELDEKVV